MQVIKSPKVYPVIVIGSGAAGGMAAWNLTQKGVQVLMLDAGDKFDRGKDWTHVRPWEARDRRAKGESPLAFYLDTKEQPYKVPDGKHFDLTRVWGLGGKTNVWGRVSLRLSEMDFKAAASDGWEIPWPISYADISPYYDKVEQMIGVCGGDDDSETLPGSKFLQPAPAPRCAERLLQKGAKSIGIDIVAGRRANMTKATRGFPPCHYCGGCGAGCDTASFFCSADHPIPFAVKTGKRDPSSAGTWPPTWAMSARSARVLRTIVLPPALGPVMTRSGRSGLMSMSTGTTGRDGSRQLWASRSG